jgi:signal transduction histidine kinase
VIVAAHDRYGTSKLAYLRNILIGFLATIPILLLLGGWFLAGRALAPIRNIVAQVTSISSQNLSTRVSTINKQDEIADLAFHFNQMLARLDVAYTLNKSFVQNASHELRTPLTALRGQVEVALLQTRTDEEYKGLLQSLHEDIVRMTALTNGLLELSLLSSHQVSPSMKPVRVDEVLWEAVDLVTKAKPGYRILIVFGDGTEESSLLVWGNDQWLRNCFQNLMENGCKFSTYHEVKVTLEANETTVFIHFRDEGVGIDPVEQERIFEPFYRSERTLNIPGNGIGLSICQRIVRLHGGQLSLTSVVGQGTTFTVQMPLADELAEQPEPVPTQQASA